MSNLQGVLFCAGFALLLSVTIWGTLRVMWWREDRRWNRFVNRWAAAAERGTDMSILKDCPDLTQLGKAGIAMKRGRLAPYGWCDNSKLGSLLCFLRLYTCPGHRDERKV